ncbi:hypothetical protein [Pseudonocardia sp. WMMC193]|uniref:hypothetical protein n=1 Tax=Pseudonocardia sp. WMMC193 TaxID=2911965 RepID=UPI001F3E7DC5|nr:hypothetical protein [Pseudonocardia sp. WMMC193]MCF7548705.1 hypothetical protein [Pseudonocardia sp. WMMC193]
MTRTRLLSLGGAALVGAAVLSLAGGLAHPVVDGRAHSVDALLAPGSPWGQLSIYAGALLLMFGLPAAYAWLAPRVGVLGFLGFSGYFLGNAVSAQAHLVVEALVAPEIARRAPELIPDDEAIVAAEPFALIQVVGGLVLVIGLIVLGVALVRQPGPCAGRGCSRSSAGWRPSSRSRRRRSSPACRSSCSAASPSRCSAWC